MTIYQKIARLRLEMDTAERSLISNFSNLNPVHMIASPGAAKSTLTKLGLGNPVNLRTLASLLPLSLQSKYGRYLILAQRLYKLIK